MTFIHFLFDSVLPRLVAFCLLFVSLMCIFAALGTDRVGTYWVFAAVFGLIAAGLWRFAE